ncbi:MAG: hypothetical protein KDB82_00510 [Planctomycetes bacterium]|nr:hypothetical protein [Planctomycetota bacterium]
MLRTGHIRIALLLLCALPLLLADGRPARALAREKAELSWEVDPDLYLHYAVDTQTAMGADDDPKPNLQYVHLMGYEIGPDGLLADRTAPFVQEEVLFQLGSYLPNAKSRAEDTWEREWNFDNVYGTQKLAVTSSWEFVDRQAYGKFDCAHIKGTHKLSSADGEAVPRWTKFELTTEGWFDDEAKLMRGMKLSLRGAKLELAPEAGEDPVTRNYLWDAEYKLVPTIDSSEHDWLKKKVEIAIMNGVERLWKLQDKEGLWPYGNHKRGGTALSLLALLMCGVDQADQRITDAFALLNEQKFQTTYDVAISIMAYEARYISKAEREAFLKGEKADKDKRDLSDEDKAEVQRLTDWLIKNRNEPNVMWNYKRDEKLPARYDFSVTQYALLGLGSAMRCGISIPPGYVRELVEFVQQQQAQDGPEIKRVVGYKPGKKKRGKKGDDKVTLSTKDVKARGWTYGAATTYVRDTGATSAYGSMTCAGITCLIGGMDIAANMDDETRRTEFGGSSQYNNWQKHAQQSLEGGMAWMEYWFSITRNPNHGRAWYYYYLYGLERICMLADVRYLGTHDWYHEGASALITLQDKDGGWGNAVDTCFALLFLKRGTVPLRKPVITGGEHD